MSDIPKIKKLAVVLCSTSNQMFAVGNVLIGLKKHFSLPEKDYDVILYIGGAINTKDENALKQIYKNIIINHYKSPLEKSMKNSNCTLMWSLMAFARYEIFDLLDKYNKILYLDTDVLIQKDIINLLDINKDISVCNDKNANIKANIEDALLTENFNSQKYDLNRKLFNSGVFLINDSIKNGKEIKEWCYKMSAEWNMADQPILNLMVQEFKLEVYDFSDKYNRFYLLNNSINDDAYILHMAYGKKFWISGIDKEWNENNEKWIELGGIAYDAEYVEKKMKEINKIAWWIPNKKLRDIYRVRQAQKFGFRWHLH